MPRARVSEPVTANGVNVAMSANDKFKVECATPVDWYVTGAGVFTVTHDLGEVPAGMLAERVDNIDVYATTTQRANNWTTTACELTASGAGNTRVWFLKRTI